MSRSPTSTPLRVQMRIEISRLHKRLQRTMIYVTHDQVEAMTLADKIVVLEGAASRRSASRWSFITIRRTALSPALSARRR